MFSNDTSMSSFAQIVSRMQTANVVHVTWIEKFECEPVDDYMRRWTNYTNQGNFITRNDRMDVIKRMIRHVLPATAGGPSSSSSSSSSSSINSIPTSTIVKPKPLRSQSTFALDQPTDATKSIPKFQHERFKLTHPVLNDCNHYLVDLPINAASMQQLCAQDMMTLIRDTGALNHYDQYPYALLMLVGSFGSIARYYVLVLPSQHDSSANRRCTHFDLLMSKPFHLMHVGDHFRSKRHYTFDIQYTHQYQPLDLWCRPDPNAMVEAWPLGSKMTQSLMIRQSFALTVCAAFSQEHILIVYLDFQFKVRRIIHLPVCLTQRSLSDMVIALAQTRHAAMITAERFAILMDPMSGNTYMVHVHQNDPQVAKTHPRQVLTHANTQVIQTHLHVANVHDLINSHDHATFKRFSSLIESCQNQVMTNDAYPTPSLLTMEINDDHLIGETLYQVERLPIHLPGQLPNTTNVDAWQWNMNQWVDMLPSIKSHVLFIMDDGHSRMLSIVSNQCFMDVIKLWMRYDPHLANHTRMIMVVHLQVDLMMMRSHEIPIESVHQHRWTIAPLQLHCFMKRHYQHHLYFDIPQPIQVVQSMMLHGYQRRISTKMLLEPTPMRLCVRAGGAMDMMPLTHPIPYRESYHRIFVWLPMLGPIDPTVQNTRYGYLAMITSNHGGQDDGHQSQLSYFAGFVGDGQSRYASWIMSNSDPQTPLMFIAHHQLMAHISICINLPEVIHPAVMMLPAQPAQVMPHYHGHTPGQI